MADVGETKESVGVRIVTSSPLNAETPLALLAAPIQEAGRLYVRSNFPTPTIDPVRYALEVVAPDGATRRFSLDDLRETASLTRTVTLECAGNGRTLLDPQPPGTAWTLGGTGTANFTGVPLAALLPDVDDAVEVVFTGADRGEAEGWGEISFQRSLPIDSLRHDPAPMVVWGMNGEPLPLEHGGPVRLVVPGWYAVASVKWLIRIELVRTPFEGCFQTERYLYLPPGEESSPVRRMRPRALVLRVGDHLLEADGISLPDAAAPLAISPGRVSVEGIAWTGTGSIDLVEVSLDGGTTWAVTEVEPESAPHVRTRWQVELDVTDDATELVARARDSEGQIQPLTSFWNELGYGNNEVQRIPLEVR